MADSDYRWLTEESKKFLYAGNGYIEEGMTVDDRVNIIAETAEKYLSEYTPYYRARNFFKKNLIKNGFARKFKDYFKRGWFSLSTPIWANFGNDRGLPISCYNSYIEDDSASILYTQSEMSMMSKLGGGTSAYFGKLRERGALIKQGRNGTSGGPLPFIETFDKNISIWSQGSTRRGSFATYLDIDHPDIMEYLTIRSPGSPIKDISFAVCVRDDWLHSMIAGDLKKREIWARVLEVRNNTGYPYLFFTDTVNNNTVDVYKDKLMRILSSNLCIETTPTSNKDESFVCDLSSLNDLYYDEWKDTDAPEVLFYLLDAVMTEFIRKAKGIPFMDRAVRYAENHRSIGIGRFGWHSYLQSKMIPFESMNAKRLNVEIQQTIDKGTMRASKKLAEEYGEPPLLKGYGRRNVLRQAIAPTTSSSWVIGQASQSIEAFTDNYHVKNLAKSKATFFNPQLLEIMRKRGYDNDEVRKGILLHGGSVQHLDFLSPAEKEVFKTMKEISPMEIIIQASQRQKYIDQAQSLNLIIDPNASVREYNAFILEAWRMGVKTLYYQFNENAAQQLGRSLLSCSSCEG